MTQKELLARGLTRMRKTRWANAEDHIEFSRSEDGSLYPWVRLWSPTNERVHGENPVEIIVNRAQDDEDDWEPYPASGGGET